MSDAKNHSTPKPTSLETQASVFASKPKPIVPTKTRRRLILEQELLKLSISQHEEQTVADSAKDWISMTKLDFSGQDFSPQKLSIPLLTLATLPSKSAIANFATPITFWSDFATKETGTTICSTDSRRLYEVGGRIKSHLEANPAPVKFGKHAGFSTMIQEYNKTTSKE